MLFIIFQAWYISHSEISDWMALFLVLFFEKLSISYLRVRAVYLSLLIPRLRK